MFPSLSLVPYFAPGSSGRFFLGYSLTGQIMTETDDVLADIFRRTRVIACVGFSPKPERPSHFVSKFLVESGYRVIPVNPGLAGAMFLGETVRARLSDIPDTDEVDMVDIFRRSDAVMPVVEEAIAVLPSLRTIWMQVGVRNAAAADLALAQGLAVVQDRCPKAEYPRLFGSGLRTARHG